MPKVLFECNDCGKFYGSEAEALACEETHASERKRKEKLQAEKKARLEAIREQYKKLLADIRKFNEDYAEPATISYTGALDRVLDSFFKLF
jgi:hypothetical protein